LTTCGQLQSKKYPEGPVAPRNSSSKSDSGHVRRLSQISASFIAVLCFLIVAESPASGNDSGKSASGDVLSIGGAEIDVRFESGDLALSRGALLGWVRESACAVTEYYGRFPVHKVNVMIAPIDEGSGVAAGRTITIDGTPQTRIAVSRSATELSLRNDWIITHEMVHLAFPSVPRQHHWIEEGIATYVEPIARAQIGGLAPEKVWRDLVDGLPQGLPGPGDQGLDNTHTWGRTYWGGALFCLLADVEIHRRTNNHFGLQDALRGIVRAGGNMDYDWPLARALKAGDDATGVPVLMELYDVMKATPVSPELSAMWDRLGVRPSGDSVVFDQTAPLASVVHSIMARRSEPDAACGNPGWVNFRKPRKD
jgi:hypothetical protein